MQVRFSTCLGMPIVAEDTEEMIGIVSGILLHPDRGTVEGFFLRGSGFFSASSLFLSAFDVTHFGRRMTVRDHDRVAPAEDFLRVRPLLADARTVLGQRVRTESGVSLGRCRDVQFDTTTLRLTWIFPKRLLRWRPSISMRDILEVREDAIVVRDPPAAAAERVTETAPPALVPMIPDLPNSA